MERITLQDKTFRTYIPYAEIDKAISRIAGQLNRDLSNEEKPVFLSILNGSFMFTADLMKKITLNCEVTFVKLSSYSGTESTGTVRQVLGLCSDIKDRTVIVLEDIVDSGTTISNLLGDLKTRNPKQIKICTLLLKPDAYKADIPIDYACIKIPNDFVVGYGLDYNNLGRQYKDLYVID
ncbi:MAG: hypoxanthine phosphoribosyltransferase [Bacteroidales bacterium]|jgi:hypoxanthine phosphoribosyltransferase|nr:hypoxanthine phosphoribosyltransferase [Bacteroidales bacterium]MDD2770676.1 hypoxanthine phosphoribosyltransferase [Bacteroidales bacterium]MDD3104520.1 hypoxanthine phosphoribosyltransferase [Bacteroidales bacterium]MDD3549058.1 hypoxanthine phosphoribosyltransferase [Bacteroidales bacterium]MDD4064054.1 hypoxanthine phosphoribosyltransferase [Bacteroidales bacterium]